MNHFHRIWFQNFRQFSNLFSQIRLKKRHTSLFSGICREIRTKIHQKFAEKCKIRRRKWKNQKLRLIPCFVMFIPFCRFFRFSYLVTFCVSVLAKRWHARTSWVEAGASRYTGSLLIWIRISPNLLSSFLEASFPYYSSYVHLRFRLRSASIRSRNHGLWLRNQILSQYGYGKYYYWNMCDRLQCE